MTIVMVLISIWQVFGNVLAAIALFGKAFICLTKNNFVSNQTLEQNNYSNLQDMLILSTNSLKKVFMRYAQFLFY